MIAVDDEGSGFKRLRREGHPLGFAGRQCPGPLQRFGILCCIGTNDLAHTSRPIANPIALRVRMKGFLKKHCVTRFSPLRGSAPQRHTGSLTEQPKKNGPLHAVNLSPHFDRGDKNRSRDGNTEPPGKPKVARTAQAATRFKSAETWQTETLSRKAPAALTTVICHSMSVLSWSRFCCTSA